MTDQHIMVLSAVGIFIVTLHLTEYYQNLVRNNDFFNAFRLYQIFNRKNILSGIDSLRIGFIPNKGSERPIP